MWDKAGGFSFPFFFSFVGEGCSELGKDQIKEDHLCSVEERRNGSVGERNTT